MSDESGKSLVLVLGLTRRFLSKDRGAIIVIQSSYGNSPPDSAIPPAPRLLMRWRCGEEAA